MDPAFIEAPHIEARSKIRVLVADDHALMRRGLGQVIEETSEMTVTGEAADGREALDLIRRDEFDVVVLDINMPGQDGLDTLKQLKVENAKLPVLVLSMHPENQYAIRVLMAGASGYLCKESAPDELVHAIRKISEGGRYVSKEVAEVLLQHLDAIPGMPLHASLSDREFQVLCQISSGKTVSEIADELALSVKTVSTYRTRLLEKMYMKSNAELTHYAIKHQLVS